MIEIQHIKGLCYTDALAIAMRAGNALLEADQSEPVPSISWDHDAVLALDEGKPVGVITWKYQEWSKTANIYIGWVEPEHRRGGIYYKLWDALVEKAKELGAKHIMGTTHMDNHAMRAVAARLGRKELSVNLSYRIE